MKRKANTVSSLWLQWFPRAGWNANFWTAVAKEVKRRRIRKGDKPKVMMICRRLWNENEKFYTYTMGE